MLVKFITRLIGNSDSNTQLIGTTIKKGGICSLRFAFEAIGKGEVSGELCWGDVCQVLVNLAICRINNFLRK